MKSLDERGQEFSAKWLEQPLEQETLKEYKEYKELDEME